MGYRSSKDIMLEHNLLSSELVLNKPDFQHTFSTEMRIVSKSAKAASGDEATDKNASQECIHYLNRDHVVSAVLSEDELIIATSLGEQIRIAGPKHELSQFIDELAKDIQSNFIMLHQSAESTAIIEKQRNAVCS